MLLPSEQAAIETWEPRVRALVGFDPDEAARRAAACRAGPLHGWSVGVKDIIDVRGTPTGCNAPFLDPPPPPAAANADVVETLETAGAFVTAKCVTTTFAYLDPGPTTNPWNTSHTPGGSSSGSAAAVACGMVRLALGTQTVGSVIRPASYCGVVGFKPTYGVVPMAGVFPFAPTVDTVGFFTRDVADMQAVWGALTSTAPSGAAGTLRVGVLPDLGCEPPSDAMMRVLHQAATGLREVGHVVAPVELPSGVAGAYEHHGRLIAAEAATSHAELFRQHGAHYPPNCAGLIERGRAVRGDAIATAHEHRRQTADAVVNGMSSVDLWISAAAPGEAPRGLDSTGDPRMNLLWTYTGLPTVTVPAGMGENDLPLGIQLTGPRGADAVLLAQARVVERCVAFQSRLSVP